MTATYIEETRKAVNTARTKVGHLLDLGEISDQAHPSRRATKAFIVLEEVLEEVPGASRCAVERIAGPLVFPIADRDPLDWPTSEGRTARQLFGQDGRFSRIASRGKVRVASHVTKKRVITANAYFEALEAGKSTPTPPVTSLENSGAFTLVTLEN